MHGPSGLASAESAWVRDGNVIMNLSRLGDPSRFGGVYLFRLASGDRLDSIARADSAEIGDGGEWTLNNFGESRFGDDALSVVRPEALNGVALWRYIGYLKDNALDSRRYEVELWRRIASAAAVAPMCVLALSFAFGQLRRAGTGARMLIGIVIGLAYFLLSRSLADGGEVFDLDPLLVGWLPTLLLAAVAFGATLRAR
jgi:lipopolysaccharide export system permease protein